LLFFSFPPQPFLINSSRSRSLGLEWFLLLHVVAQQAVVPALDRRGATHLRTTITQ
jgi:hypothetical protein